MINFCVQCGSKLERKQVQANEPERYVCTVCNHVQYENPVPTAGVFLTRGNEVLLVKRGVEPYKGMWDVPGGFLEKHEHPESGASRELREELGIEIKIEKLVAIIMGTYADANVSTLNIYYRAHAIKGKMKPQSDVIDAQWFSLDALPEVAFPQNTEALKRLKSDLAKLTPASRQKLIIVAAVAFIFILLITVGFLVRRDLMTSEAVPTTENEI